MFSVRRSRQQDKAEAALGGGKAGPAAGQVTVTMPVTYPHCPASFVRRTLRRTVRRTNFLVDRTFSILWLRKLRLLKRSRPYLENHVGRQTRKRKNLRKRAFIIPLACLRPVSGYSRSQLQGVVSYCKTTYCYCAKVARRVVQNGASSVSAGAGAYSFRMSLKVI